MIYLKKLRNLMKDNGSNTIVYVDESGFKHDSIRKFGWSKRGTKIIGECSGIRHTMVNLMAGKCRDKLLAPVLFEGTANAELFNEWLEKHLFNELPDKATVIMDNAAFHKTVKTRDIFNKSCYQLLYLPPYSPDFNPIEKDFAIIKKRRQFAKKDITLEQIIKSYGN